MKKKLIVRQEEISDCGACCLLSIIRYYDGKASLENIKTLSLTNHTGVTALNLINCAKRYGFDAKGYKIDTLKDINFPIIAHVNINKSLSHFIVIYDELDTCFIIMDPAKGEIKIDKEELYKIFSGNIITLRPKILINDNIENNITKNKLKTIYKSNIKYLIVILLLLIMIMIFSIVIDLFLNISLITDNKKILFYAFIVLIIIKESLSILVQKNKLKMTQSCSLKILEDFFEHILRLPLKYIHLKDPGEIVKRTKEMENISQFMIDFILNIATNIITITPILLILFHINKPCLILTLICSITYMIYVIYSNRNIKELIDSNMLTSINYYSLTNNYISRLNSIRHIDNDSYFLNNLKEKRDNYYKEEYRYRKQIYINNSIKTIIITLFQLINNYILISNYYKGTISLESIIAINALFMSVTTSIDSIANEIPSFIYYQKLMKRIDDFYNIEEDRVVSEVVRGDIHIANLSYSYNGIDKILNNINLDIKRGEKVFIKGISGIGKSTLCKIISKDLIDYKGTLTIDDKNLRNISIKIGYLSQDEALFIGTIKENILLGRDIPQKRYEDILKICNLEQVIKNKPFQYDTYLYGSSLEISGGEKNLILLARCLIEEKDIYILDESLANVNEETEIKVINNILSYFQDKTIIYVSHRDKSKYFNRIINV